MCFVGVVDKGTLFEEALVLVFSQGYKGGSCVVQRSGYPKQDVMTCYGIS